MILLLVSCTDDSQDPGYEMPLLHPAPQAIDFNPEAGYSIHPLTGKLIQAMVNSLGDTLKTGVPIAISGRSIHPDRVRKPEIVPAGMPISTSASLNVSQLPEALHVIPVNKASLETGSPDLDLSSSVLVNSTGDTIPSGVPLPINGELGPCFQSQPVKAFLPAKKDVARIHMKYLDVEQGMNSSHVLSVLEDQHGNLWFSTGGGGVSMYNGNTFTHYTEEEGLSNNIVWTILEDRKGHLWFGTYGGGISRYDGRNFTHFTEKVGLSDNHIRSMLEDSRGNLWIGTWQGGVSRYKADTITHFTEREGFCTETVNSIFEDSRGNLWFATNGRGVIRFDGQSFTHYTEKEGLGNNMVLSVLEDSQGNMWFGTDGGGVVKYGEDSFTLFTEREGLSNNSVRAILEDSHGRLWFGTEQGGVNLFSGNRFWHYTENEGLSNNSVNALFEDRQGNLWIGTEYGGVSIYNAKSFSHYTRNEGMRDERIRSLLEDKQGNIWCAPWNGGVSLYREGVVKHFAGEQGFCNSAVFTMLEDSRGDIWFGTGGSGAISYNGQTFTYYGEAEGLGNNHVRSVLEDRQGRMWFGTWGGGVSRYENGTFTQFTEREGLTNNYVRALMEDSQGQIWFGTYGGGVSMYDGETLTSYTEREGLSSNLVLSILEDSKGSMWFGTYGGGVNLLKDNSITHFTENEGLSNNIVQSVVEDRLGNIWVSTEKGINLIQGEARISIYGLQDGLKGSDFILNSVLADSKNRLWWGSSKSLTMLDMNSFEVPVHPPEIQLNDVKINDRFVDYRQMKEDEGLEMEYTSVANFYNYPLNPELPYKNNHLTFRFSAIDWSAPHQIKYSFRIEGLQEDWSLPSALNTADYRKLPHGSYTFMVRAIGGAQVWSESFEYPFSISPPWWHSWWARVLYVLVLLWMVYSFVRLRTARLKRQHKALAAEVFQATNQVREQKEEIESQRDELLATNQALGQQKKELQLMVENLKLTQSQLVQSEKMASVGLLTAGIAHELNNPVNFVGGSVNPLKRDLNELFLFIEKCEKILEDNRLDKIISEVNDLKEKLDFDFLSKEIISLLEGIEEGANRSSQIVKGLRSFSRLDEEKCQLFDIHEGIDSTLILLQNKIKNRIKIRTEYGDFEEVECYPSKLNQVFLNILTNSIQAIEGKGEIFIQTIRSGIGIKIIIKDNGKGMSPEIKRKIFDPFFTTKEVGEGTGLGLSISFGIIEQHKGNIDVISEPGKGTEFIISLPLTQSD